jgi:pyruvate dehydrogenase E2 component (dihydrolipoamide acetyltransferase)
MSEAAPGGGAPGNRGQVRIEEPTRAQRTVARRTAESRATIPHFELTAEIDFTRAAEQVRERRCSLSGLLTHAVALALREVPKANGAYRDGHFELHERVNVGLVVATAEALTIPVVFDADQKSIHELDRETERLTARAQEQSLTPPELSGSTATLLISSDRAPTAISPVIVPPHAAAIAVGAIRESAVVRNGSLIAGQMLTITLAADHRILYGADATRFLAEVRRRLEAPEALSA